MIATLRATLVVDGGAFLVGATIGREAVSHDLRDDDARVSVS
jgi:hypothetical protein